MMDGARSYEDALTGEQKIRNFNINLPLTSVTGNIQAISTRRSSNRNNPA